MPNEPIRLDDHRHHDDAAGRRDKAVGVWVPCVLEPLVALEHRARAEAELIEVCVVSPVWAMSFWGGVIADLACTLPEVDVWRAYSARAGDETLGPNPPAWTGALGEDGVPLGRWDDFLSFFMGPVADVDEDVDLAMAVVPLDLPAGALIAFGFAGWRRCTLAARAVSAEVGSERFARSALDAFRWASYRRRAWMGGPQRSDTFPANSVYTWAARAANPDFGDEADEAAVAEDILRSRIHPSDL